MEPKGISSILPFSSIDDLLMHPAIYDPFFAEMKASSGVRRIDSIYYLPFGLFYQNQ